MAIYRGSGGSTSTTDQATIDQVAEDAATATTKAAEAAASASSASSSASSATSSATSAASSASSASSSASSASTSASNASSSATAAASSATSAASSATSAASANTNAQTAKTAAEAAQSAAESAETAAETAESNASDHADDAVKAAYGAEDVLQTLSDSSTLYSARHYAAKTAADATSTATNAATASSAATAAEAARDATLAAYDNFDDRYLGAKASDPTVDNDGNPLVAGSLYFNTTVDGMKVYEGSAWVAAYISAGASGALLATNNLSDVPDAGSARTNLGVAIGSNVQAHSTVLDNTTASYTTAEETKLAGIETGADVTDTANVTAAGALMDSEVTNLAQVKAFSSADYATAAQGTLADSAIQPSDNISTLTNDSGYITGVSVSGISDTTITTPADNEVLAYDTTSSKWINQTAAEAGLATAAQGALADSALQSFTETDPVVGAISGIVKADGAGNISAASAGTDYQAPLTAGTDYLAPNGDGSALTNLPNPVASQATAPTAEEGKLWYETDTKKLWMSDGTNWIVVHSDAVTLDSISGDILENIASDLTLTGTNFGEANLVVNFTNGSTLDEDVTVTPTSQTQATVSVPSAIYTAVVDGNTIDVSVTSEYGWTSSAITKTVVLPTPLGLTATFTSSQNWTIPTGAYYLEIYCIGGGGNGYAWSGCYGGGGGGGGVGWATDVPKTVFGSNTVAVTVGGAGGASDVGGLVYGNQGVNGSTSSQGGGNGTTNLSASQYATFVNGSGGTGNAYASNGGGGYGGGGGGGYACNSGWGGNGGSGGVNNNFSETAYRGGAGGRANDNTGSGGSFPAGGGGGGRYSGGGAAAGAVVIKY